MVNSINDKKKIAENVAEVWNKNHVNYAVVHGLERYPDEIGRDLDIFISRQDILIAIESIRSLLENTNLMVFVHGTSWGHYYIFICDNHRLILEIDLIPRYQWSAVCLAVEPVVDKKNKEFKIDVWASFIKRILLQILGGNTQKFIDKPYELALNEEEVPIIAIQLKKLLGNDLADKFIKSILNANLAAIKQLVKTVRKKLFFSELLHHPHRFFLGLCKWFFREIQHYLSPPCIPIIAIVGTDGVGKTTVINQICKSIKQVLPVPEVYVKHWRPNLLPNIRNIFSRKRMYSYNDTGSIQPRRRPGYFLILRLLYYYLDFLLGGYFLDRKSSAHLNLIIYDRCALDMYVDPVRFGLSSNHGMQLFWRLIPKPDAVIFLYDDPENIVRRKAELSVKEIERQQTEWFKLYENGWVTHALKVEGTPVEVAQKLDNIFIDTFIQKHASKNKQVNTLQPDINS